MFNILVVDDDRSTRLLMQALLEDIERDGQVRGEKI